MLNHLGVFFFFLFFFFFFPKVRVGAKEGGSLFWEMAVAITCGYGGYLLPLLAAHSSYSLRLDYEWAVSQPATRSSRSVNGTENTNRLLTNRLMKLVVVTICNFGFSGTDHSKFYSDMYCALPEGYEKFQLFFHYSFWLTTNWIKHVSDGILRVFTSAH